MGANPDGVPPEMQRYCMAAWPTNYSHIAREVVGKYGTFAVSFFWRQQLNRRLVHLAVALNHAVCWIP